MHNHFITKLMYVLFHKNVAVDRCSTISGQFALCSSSHLSGEGSWWNKTIYALPVPFVVICACLFLWQTRPLNKM